MALCLMASILTMSLPSFSEYMNLLHVLESALDSSECIEDFLESMSTAGVGIAAVTTSDIGGVVLPLGMMRRRSPIDEEGLKGSQEAQAFLAKNMRKYKSVWKDKGEEIAKSVAQHLFLRKAESKGE